VPDSQERDRQFLAPCKGTLVYDPGRWHDVAEEMQKVERCDQVAFRDSSFPRLMFTPESLSKLGTGLASDQWRESGQRAI